MKNSYSILIIPYWINKPGEGQQGFVSHEFFIQISIKSTNLKKT